VRFVSLETPALRDGVPTLARVNTLIYALGGQRGVQPRACAGTSDKHFSRNNSLSHRPDCGPAPLLGEEWSDAIPGTYTQYEPVYR
jgi:hypothetical protein